MHPRTAAVCCCFVGGLVFCIYLIAIAPKRDVQPDWQVKAHKGGIYALLTTPSGQIVTGGADGKIRLWQCKNDVPVSSFDLGSTSVLALACSGDGKNLAIACESGDVTIWNINESAAVRRFSAYPLWPSRIALTDDGKFAIARTEKGTVSVSSIASGIAKFKIDNSAAGITCFTAAAGSLVAVDSSQEVREWSLANGRQVSQFRAACRASFVEITKDHRFVALGGGGDGIIGVYDILSGRCIGNFNSGCHTCYAATFSADGKFLAAGGRGGRSVGSGRVRAWDLCSGNMICEIDYGFSAYSMCFSENDELIVGSADGRLMLFDLASYAKTHVPSGLIGCPK